MDPFFLFYSDDNKKNTFNNGGDIGHALKMLHGEQTFNVFDSRSFY